MPKRVPELTESFITIISPHTENARDVSAPPLPVKLGTFTIVRSLGAGGSGLVYEAVRSDEKRVALKVLRAEHVASPREIDRFRREAEHLAGLAHPAIIALDEVGFLPDGRPFLAMPLLEGETLATRLERGPLPLQEAVAHFEILADALDTCHRAGLVHRDLKPENVFYARVDGVVRPILLDLGIAHSIDEPTRTTASRIRGTPIYMAPERLLGTTADVASDIYELAVVFAMMLLGRFPWRSTRSISERLSPLPDEIAWMLPRALVRVLRLALSGTPEERPTTAAQLADEVAFAMLLDSARGGEEEDSEAEDPPSAAGTERGHGRCDPRCGRPPRRGARDAERDGEGHRAASRRESGVALSVLPGSRGDRRRMGSEGARTGTVDPRGRRLRRAR